MKVKIDFPVYDAEDNETVYEIECRLQPSTPDVWYLPNGDPGYPGDPAECEILTVKLNGVEVADWEKLFDNKAQGDIENAAWEAAPSKDDDDDPRGWEPGGN